MYDIENNESDSLNSDEYFFSTTPFIEKKQTFDLKVTTLNNRQFIRNEVLSIDISRDETKMLFLEQLNQLFIYPLKINKDIPSQEKCMTVPYYPCSMAKFAFSDEMVLLTTTLSCKPYYLIE